MQYRKAVPEDIPELIKMRKQQLIDEGLKPDIDIDQTLYAYFQKAFREDSLVEWLVLDHNKIIATGAISFLQFPPTYTNKTGIKGYITNMFTEEAYRGRGIAKALLHKLTEEAKERGVTKLWLGASRMGRPVYLKFGFQETDEWLELDL